MITHSAKNNMTTEKAVKVGVEVTGKLGVGVGGQHLKKGVGNIGGSSQKHSTANYVNFPSVRL